MADFPTDSLASVGVCLLEWGRFWWLRDSVDTDGYNWKGPGRCPGSFSSLIANRRQPAKSREGKRLAQSPTADWLKTQGWHFRPFGSIQ